MGDLRVSPNAPRYDHIADEWAKGVTGRMTELRRVTRAAVLELWRLTAIASEGHARWYESLPWHRKVWHTLTGHR